MLSYGLTQIRSMFLQTQCLLNTLESSFYSIPVSWFSIYGIYATSKTQDVVFYNLILIYLSIL
jgi:hypothetical protein